MTLAQKIRNWLFGCPKCERCGRELHDRKSIARGMGPECYRAYVKESNKLLKRGPVNYFDDVIRQTNPPSPTPPAEQKESAIGRWQREYGPMAMYQKEKEKEEEKCDQ